MDATQIYAYYLKTSLKSRGKNLIRVRPRFHEETIEEETHFKSLNEIQDYYFKKDSECILPDGIPSDLFICAYSPTPIDLLEKKFIAGPAGDLFEKMLTAMKLSRNLVYCSYVHKHKDEQVYEDLFKKELEFIKPKIILNFGENPFFENAQFDNVFSTYHPEELISDPSKKKQTWDVLQKVMKCLG